MGTNCAPLLADLSVAEHEQYKTGALKRKRQAKQSGNILK
jgi:hypothetical protein